MSTYLRLEQLADQIKNSGRLLFYGHAIVTISKEDTSLCCIDLCACVENHHWEAISCYLEVEKQHRGFFHWGDNASLAFASYCRKVRNAFYSFDPDRIRFILTEAERENVSNAFEVEREKFKKTAAFSLLQLTHPDLAQAIVEWEEPIPF